MEDSPSTMPNIHRNPQLSSSHVSNSPYQSDKIHHHASSTTGGASKKDKRLKTISSASSQHPANNESTKKPKISRIQARDQNRYDHLYLYQKEEDLHRIDNGFADWSSPQTNRRRSPNLHASGEFTPKRRNLASNTMPLPHHPARSIGTAPSAAERSSLASTFNPASRDTLPSRNISTSHHSTKLPSDRTEYHTAASREMNHGKKRKLTSIYQRNEKLKHLNREVQERNGISRRQRRSGRDSASSDSESDQINQKPSSQNEASNQQTILHKAPPQDMLYEFEYSSHLREQMEKLKSALDLASDGESWLKQRNSKLKSSSTSGGDASHPSTASSQNRTKMRRISQKLHKLNTQNSALQTDNDSLRELVHQLQQENDEVNDSRDHHKEKYDALKKQYGDLNQKLRQLVEEQNRLRLLVKQYSEKHNNSDDHVAHLEHKVTKLTHANQELHQEMSKQDQKIKQLNQIRRQQIATIQELSKAKRKFENRLKRRSTLTAGERTTESSTPSSPSHHQSRMQSRIQSLEQQVTQLRKFNEKKSEEEVPAQTESTPPDASENISEASPPASTSPSPSLQADIPNQTPPTSFQTTNHDEESISPAKNQETLRPDSSHPPSDNGTAQSLDQDSTDELHSLRQKLISLEDLARQRKVEIRKLQDLVQIRQHQCTSKDEQIFNLKQEIRILSKSKQKQTTDAASSGGTEQLHSEISTMQHQMESYKNHIEQLKSDVEDRDAEIRRLKNIHKLDLDRLHNLEADLSRRRQLQRKESVSGLKIRTFPRSGSLLSQQSQQEEDTIRSAEDSSFLDVVSPSQYVKTPDPDIDSHLDALNLPLTSPSADEYEEESSGEGEDDDEFNRLVEEVKSSPTATAAGFEYSDTAETGFSNLHSLEPNHSPARNGDVELTEEEVRMHPFLGQNFDQDSANEDDGEECSQSPMEEQSHHSRGEELELQDEAQHFQEHSPLADEVQAHSDVESEEAVSLAPNSNSASDHQQNEHSAISNEEKLETKEEDMQPEKKDSHQGPVGKLLLNPNCASFDPKLCSSLLQLSEKNGSLLRRELSNNCWASAFTKDSFRLAALMEEYQEPGSRLQLQFLAKVEDVGDDPEILIGLSSPSHVTDRKQLDTLFTEVSEASLALHLSEGSLYHGTDESDYCSHLIVENNDIIGTFLEYNSTKREDGWTLRFVKFPSIGSGYENLGVAFKNIQQWVPNACFVVSMSSESAFSLTLVGGESIMQQMSGKK